MDLKNNRGFTLIELLVVVAIISLLSSIVFASLGSARNKARNAAIMQEVNEFAKLLEFEYSDYHSYSGLQVPEWKKSGTPCLTEHSGGVWGFESASPSYEAQAATICNKIIDLMPPPTASLGFIPYVNGAGETTNNYSLVAGLWPGGTYYCVGSSGRKTVGATQAQLGSGSTGTGSPGCYWNP